MLDDNLNVPEKTETVAFNQASEPAFSNPISESNSVFFAAKSNTDTSSTNSGVDSAAVSSMLNNFSIDSRSASPQGRANGDTQAPVKADGATPIGAGPGKADVPTPIGVSPGKTDGATPIGAGPGKADGATPIDAGPGRTEGLKRPNDGSTGGGGGDVPADKDTMFTALDTKSGKPPTARDAAEAFVKAAVAGGRKDAANKALGDLGDAISAKISGRDYDGRSKAAVGAVKEAFEKSPQLKSHNIEAAGARPRDGASVTVIASKPDSEVKVGDHKYSMTIPLTKNGWKHKASFTDEVWTAQGRYEKYIKPISRSR